MSSVKNQLFNGIEPITQYGSLALNDPVIVANLPGFAQKISSVCGLNLNSQTVLPYLGISTAYNATNALYRGLELSGRVRATRQFYVDYSYDVQSSQQTGIPITILVNNPFVIDGGQIYGIPVHKGSLTADFNDLHGLETQIQGYYVGDNNTLNRPAFTFFNGFVSHSVGRGLRATLSATNLFNQNWQLYGYFGHQLFVPENGFQPQAKTSIQQAVTLGNGTQEEEMGLSPRVILFSLSAQI